ncbi:type II secretion system minor pseudopilin GspJ [Endozoicomonas sp. Mp262]|uniref:type II secretion system minor pseudopilin GspJ n=1 Tax=Endozoicomonas sp. Mp262 TaxID=2919499 RepID=UPI0021D9D779
MNVQKGFTLLELMIAILIFAMISTAAYKLFESVTKAQQVTDGLLDSLDEIQRTQITIEKDLMQMSARSIRNEFGDKEPAVFGPTKEGDLLVFTRTGWRNPLNSTRSDLQRVAYAFEEGELVRYYWPVLDRAPDPVVIRQTLLSDVRAVQVRFMDEKKLWKPAWPPFKEAKESGKKEERESAVMPVAVEVAVQHEYYGLLEATIPLMTFKEKELQGKDEEKGEGSGSKRRQKKRNFDEEEFEEDER